MMEFNDEDFEKWPENATVISKKRRRTITISILIALAIILAGLAVGLMEWAKPIRVFITHPPEMEVLIKILTDIIVALYKIAATVYILGVLFIAIIVNKIYKEEGRMKTTKAWKDRKLPDLSGMPWQDDEQSIQGEYR